MKKNSKKKQTYVRLGQFKLKEVLPFVTTDKKIRDLLKAGVKRGSKEWKNATEKIYEGQSVKMYSQRYRVFKTFGVVCKKCGIKGKFFALERQKHNHGNTNRFHFNLYAVDSKGHEVLMTKDHIIPKSKGGENKLDNLQPMCINCNAAKGATEE